jgi:hypothetical protein
MATFHDRFKLAALNGALDELDVGSADPNGDMQLLDAAGPTELAQPQLSNPAFAAAAMNGANPEADANPIADDTDVTEGDIATMKLRDRDNVAMYEGSVGLPGSGANIIMDDVTVPPGADFVGISNLTFSFAFGS